MADDESTEIASDSKGLRDRFFRERRLLLGLSLALLAHQVLGISVGKSAESLGIRFVVPNPSLLWKAVAVIWAWTLVSYWQLFNTLRPLQDYPDQRDAELRERLSQQLMTWQVRRATRQFVRRHLAGVCEKSEARNAGLFLPVDRSGRSQPSVVQVAVTVHWHCGSSDPLEKVAAEFDEEMKRHGWRTGGGDLTLTHTRAAFVKVVSSELNAICDSKWMRMISRAWTLTSTSMLTGYLAPFMVGLAPAFVHWVPPAARGCVSLLRTFCAWL